MFILQPKNRNFVSNAQGEVEYYNDTETIGYMGISRRIGKVVIINSALNADIYFKPEHLLANTSGMALEKKKKFLELGLRAWSKFKPSADTKTKIPQIFLQTSHGLIEKELGVNEEIVLNRSSIFAFSSKIKFTNPQLQFKHQAPAFIRAKGPGLLYIENRHDHATQLPNYTKNLTLLVVFWLYIILSLGLWHAGIFQG